MAKSAHSSLFQSTSTDGFQVLDGMGLDVDENDTERIMDRLEAGDEVDDVLSGTEGPYVPA